MHRPRAAFTLMEIMLAIMIALLVVAIAVPMMANTFGGRSLEDTFHDFDAFVRKAHDRSLKEGRTYVLVWQKEGITMEAESPSADDPEGEVESYAFGEAKILIERPVSLDPKPLAEWAFWRSGVCEPVRIHYESPDGTWMAEFDSLTARGNLLELKNN